MDLSNSINGAVVDTNGHDDVDIGDLIPDFQRVKISGEDNTGVPVEDLHTASHLLVRALSIREKYMNVSHQEFPSDVQRFVLYENWSLNKHYLDLDILMG